MLSIQGNLEVVGEAADGQDAMELCRRLRPDLVLMDVNMPRMDGIEATRAIKRELPRTVVLMMTASAAPQYLAQLLKAGAAGYVVKSARPQQITDTIPRVLEGESPLDQQLAKDLLLELMHEERSSSRGVQQEREPSP